MARHRQLVGGVAALALAGAIAWACSGPMEAPTWDVAKSGYDPYGSGAILSPANDTRANMLLLMADRQGIPLVSAKSPATKVPLIFASWRVFEREAVGAVDDPTAPTPPVDNYADSRCQTVRSGAADFRAAVMASKASAEDKQALVTVRDAMEPDCNANKVGFGNVAAATPVGRDFATYLRGAADFYSGQFDQANERFASLGRSENGWVRETARYMIARTLLNKALANSIGDYGELEEAAKRDVATAQAADRALRDYVKSYPNGRYAISAMGLTRRAQWIAGQGDALAQSYDNVIPAVRDIDGALDLIGEVDYKLGLDNPGGRARSPLLLAVQDLERMRGLPTGYYGDRPEEPAKIGKAELDAQAPLFANDKALFGYLQAAHAFWVRKDPKAVLSIIPDAAHQQRFTYLEFSRQMLRGMALDATNDRNARGFWLSLFPGAVQPYQRGAVELALAQHDDRTGNAAAALAPNSPVRHRVIRDLLLEYSSGPALLRQQMKGGMDPHERRIAAFVLLMKQLQHGQYRDFVVDLPNAPKGSTEQDYGWAAETYDAQWNDGLGDPPLGVFQTGPDAASGCAAIGSIAGALSIDPAAPRPVLCLAEFFRRNGFDDLQFDSPPEWVAFARGPRPFPGKKAERMPMYEAVLANPRSTPDDKAMALNRMVRCYAPSGSSSCGGAEVPQATRKAWFNRLKASYPASRWAKDLRYYW